MCTHFRSPNQSLVSSRILKSDVKIAIRFNFESNYAARQRVPIILNPGTL
jgi:hypothetical protein